MNRKWLIVSLAAIIASLGIFAAYYYWKTKTVLVHPSLIEACVHDELSLEVLPEVPVIWSVKDASVASVDDAGNITAVGVGETHVEATACLAGTRLCSTTTVTVKVCEGCYDVWVSDDPPTSESRVLWCGGSCAEGSLFFIPAEHDECFVDGDPGGDRGTSIRLSCGDNTEHAGYCMKKIASESPGPGESHWPFYSGPDSLELTADGSYVCKCM